MTIATGTDATSGNVLRITSPALDLNTADYKAFILKMQNTVFNANSKVKLVIQTTDGDKTYETPVTSMNDAQYGFDISDCTGTITGFYFEPTNVDCTINVDYIGFASGIKVTYHANTTEPVTGMPGTEYVVAGMNYTVSTAKPTRSDYRLVGWSETPDGAALVGNQIPVTADKTLYAIWKYNDSWDFSTDNDFEGWSTVNLINASVSGGILSAAAKNMGTDASPRYDPIIGVTPAKVDTSVYDKVVVRMAYTLPAGINSTSLQVYFTTEAQPSMSEATLKSVTLSGNSSNGFIDVELDMSTNSLWGGSKLTSLRIDPIYGAGSFQIDSIKLVATPHQI